MTTTRLERRVTSGWSFMPLVVAMVVIAGCNGGPAPADGGAGGNGAGGKGAGGAGAGGAGVPNVACATAVSGASCTAEGAFCGGEGCTNICQFCNVLHCTNGRWEPMESAPAPCFACGPNTRCPFNSSYCRTTSGGPVGTPTTYECKDVPKDCLPTPTCACLQTASQPGSCTSSGVGALTLSIAAS
jgi:hypothetical protein